MSLSEYGSWLPRTERWAEWYCDRSDDRVLRHELLRCKKTLKIREKDPGRQWPQMDSRAFNTGGWNAQDTNTVLLETICSECGRITRARIHIDLMVRYGNGTPLEDLFDEPEQLAYLNDGICIMCFTKEREGNVIHG